MPKIRPKAIVARVILGEKWQERNNSDYLLYVGNGHRLSTVAWDDDDNDDGSSIISTSTSATVDNKPGTGRFIDTYIFQPMGRRIERLAMRFTIASLHPARIVQYIEAYNSLPDVGYQDSVTLQDAIANICSWSPNGSTVVAGMKGLVKQTQSNSIDKSAFALAALILVSLPEYQTVVYVNVSRIEPIFQLETLARSLPCSHPDKKWFLLLVKFAKEIVTAAKEPSIEKFFDPVLGKDALQVRPSPETAQNLRQRLILTLKEYKSHRFNSLEDTIGKACAICSEAASSYICFYERGTAYMHILEIIYFTVLFVLQSIQDLADSARITANRHIYTVLRTLVCWLDAVVFRCLVYSTNRKRNNMDVLNIFIALRSLVLVHDDTKYMLLLESYRYARNLPVSDKDVLPRRHREATEWNEEAPPIQTLIEAAKRRTRRLLRSFDELEREVWGCSWQNNSFTSQAKIDADPFWIRLDDFGEAWWNHWGSTLAQARRVQVPENCLTEEFRGARRIGLQCDPAVEEKWRYSFDERNWAYYELRRSSRHKWGQYLRSNMDWDWDLGSCMRRLFKVEKQTRVGTLASPDMQTPPASCPRINVDAGTEGILRISMGEAQGSLPREVKIAYTTTTGKTQYLTFAPLSPIPGNTSVSEHPCIAEPSAEDRSQKATFEGQQEINDSEAGTSSPDISFLKASEDSAVEETCNDCEGKDIEVPARGDAISICSL